MTPDASADRSRHGQIKQLFNAACDLPNIGAQRAALLSLGADDATQRELLALLAPPGGVTRFSAAVAQAATQWLGSPLRPGDPLGAWTLLRPLGEGGMGRVYLAERSDGHYQQKAAIKLLLGWSGAEALARLTSERQILARLNHAHIAKLLDGGTTPAGQPYLVMEYADGDTLDHWCARRQAPLADRLALFGSVCEAVAHAHRHGVIHCDIKPANVLVNAEGRVMLLDFGIARLEGQAGDAAVGMSAGYASPEQEAGQAPGLPSDIFSLGRLLAELVTPVLPAAARPQRDALLAIVAKATAHAADQRYGSAAALHFDLQRLPAHRAGEAPGDGADPPRRGRRRPWAWALAGGVAGVLALGAMAVLTSRLAEQLETAQANERQARQDAAQALGQAAQARQAEREAWRKVDNKPSSLNPGF